MEVLLIEKDTLNCILDEHQHLCDMIISLAGHIRRKKPDEMLSVVKFNREVRQILIEKCTVS
ncbi:hypothetical protein EEL51_13860 [Muribaculaceae bacterium Isolate-110 (HZI)]|nr:hypothetical protein EEL51_13860 [Muribaculaceae bacterium Isolate-110 (HZI)]